MNDVEIMQNLKHFKVLYVENDSFQMEQTITILSMYFKNITTATDGFEALNIFKKNTFDLIICDIFLPKISGTEFAQEVRELDKNIDFIFISSSTNINDFRKVIQIQAFDFLSKPYSFADLQDVLIKFGKKYIKDRTTIVEITTNIQYDILNHCIIIDDKRIDLTLKEQQLLQLATKNKKNVFTYEQISEALNYKEINMNSIKNIILRLRKKLSTDIFVNIKGLGYRIV
ncbi:MAG: response regulator transcription factor [Aliarcobacter sp.]|nr:response regulator transcription factor [Aliarcobacter sp.]